MLAVVVEEAVDFMNAHLNAALPLLPLGSMAIEFEWALSGLSE